MEHPDRSRLRRLPTPLPPPGHSAAPGDPGGTPRGLWRGVRSVALTRPGAPRRVRFSRIAGLPARHLGDQLPGQRRVLAVYVEARPMDGRGDGEPQAGSRTGTLAAGDAVVLQQVLDHLGLVDDARREDEPKSSLAPRLPVDQVLPAHGADVVVRRERAFAFRAVTQRNPPASPRAAGGRRATHPDPSGCSASVYVSSGTRVPAHPGA